MLGTRAAAAVVMVALVLALAPTAATAQEVVQANTVTVSARQTVDIEPDLAIVTLGTQSKSVDASKALDKLAAKTNRVLAAMRDLGLGADELNTTGVSLSRTCLRDCRDPNPRDDVEVKPVIGYVGFSGVRVETGRLNLLGRILDAGVDAGASSIRGLRFDVEDKDAAVNEALREAMESAVSKATVLAETGGRQLGPAIIITEGFTRAPVAYDYGAVPVADAAGGTAGGAGFSVDPPTLSATARIVVTFELI
ncbi:MAG: SIMPL domain-containing protein [Actinomycetota bacterium]